MSASRAGWYHFPCGLANGAYQEDGKTWCSTRCSKGPRKAPTQTEKGRHQRPRSRSRKGQGRGRKKVQISHTVPFQSSQSSQELFSSATQEHPSAVDIAEDGATGCLHGPLEPINAQEIKIEINGRKEERDRDADFLFCGCKTQELQISKTEILEVENRRSAREEENLQTEEEEDGRVEKHGRVEAGGEDEHGRVEAEGEEEHGRVEVGSPFATSSISNCNTQSDIAQAGTTGLVCDKVYENYEADFLGKESEADLGLPESPEKQSEITLNTTSDSLIEVVEEVKAPPTGEEPDNQEFHLLKTQLELTEGLLAAKRAELEQQEVKHNEDIKLYKKRLEAKECEITLLQSMEEEKKKSEIKKKEDEWKSLIKKKEAKWKVQANTKDEQILRLRSQLEKEKSEKIEIIEKLAAIYQILRPQDSAMNEDAGEYVEKLRQEESTSAGGVKREPEEVEQNGGEQKKSRYSL